MLSGMKTLQGQFEDLTIDTSTTIQGAVTRELTVVAGNVVVQGAVGRLIARGGQTKISGVVSAITLAGGEVQISAGTILGSEVLQDDGTWRRLSSGESVSVGPHFAFFDARDVLQSAQ